VAGAHDSAASVAAILNGRRHPQLGAVAVKSVSPTLGLGMTAGAVKKRIPPVEPNEDAGAIVGGPRADLLVVADAHFGALAAEIAVEHVLAAIGDDPPPSDLPPAELVALVFEAGVAVRQATTARGCLTPESATTLALALVTEHEVQWASFGDSCIVVTHGHEGRRLDTRRGAYLGQAFDVGEVEELMSHGRYERRDGDCVIVATDGLADVIAPGWSTMAVLVSAYVERTYGAGAIVESLVDLALQREAADAVTLAVASGYAM
jgi:serine/threonine protein phosphatase PrpC